MTLVVGGGASSIKSAEMKADSKTVALHARRPTARRHRARDLRNARLLNIVEEMAIASGVPVPPVYLLPQGERHQRFRRRAHAGRRHRLPISHGCLR